MKQIVVLSGKGGTGKTTVTAALAHLMAQDARLVLVDADVDAANLGLILTPTILEEHEFIGGQIAEIDPIACTACGRCLEVCRFDAVRPVDGHYRVDPIGCEGCAACFYQCPEQAISMADNLAGHWYRSDTRFGRLIHADLKPGQENSGKLVSQIRQEALRDVSDAHADWILVDGSPGIGCAVIAAVAGADLALLVAEPTISGVHDMERALQVTAHFRVPSAVCINKSDLNLALGQEIADYCAAEHIPLLTKLPYDENVLDAMRQGRAITEVGDSVMAQRLVTLWEGLRALLQDDTQ